MKDAVIEDFMARRLPGKDYLSGLEDHLTMDAVSRGQSVEVSWWNITDPEEELLWQYVKRKLLDHYLSTDLVVATLNSDGKFICTRREEEGVLKQLLMIRFFHESSQRMAPKYYHASVCIQGISSSVRAAQEVLETIVKEGRLELGDKIHVPTAQERAEAAAEWERQYKTVTLDNVLSTKEKTAIITRWRAREFFFWPISGFLLWLIMAGAHYYPIPLVLVLFLVYPAIRWVFKKTLES